MSTAHRRTSLRLLTAIAFGALVLTGCGETGTEPAEPAAAADSAPADVSETTAPSSGGGSQDSQAPTGETRWAGTKQFVTIDKAWTEDGVTHLSVRPARKKVITRFDNWQIIPGKGPFTTVTMTKEARILLTAQVRGDDPSGVRDSAPLPYSQAEFVTLLKQMDPSLSAGIGYDLSFDGEGRVTKVQSLYTA